MYNCQNLQRTNKSAKLLVGSFKDILLKYKETVLNTITYRYSIGTCNYLDQCSLHPTPVNLDSYSQLQEVFLGHQNNKAKVSANYLLPS